MLPYLKSFFTLIRWFHELLAVLPFAGLYAVIEYYARKNGVQGMRGADFLLLCFCVQLLIAAGCILNDIMDRDIDRINKPRTHIIGRTISLRHAKQLFFGTTLLIAALSVYITVYMFSEWMFISAAVYVLSVLYDVYFKKSPLLGNILIAVLASFVPLVLFFFAKDCITALHNEKISVLIYLYSFFPFMIIIPRELSLDISDMEGDRACGCRTLPIVIGARRAKRVVVLFIVTLMLLSCGVVYAYPYLALPFAGVEVLLAAYLLQLRCAETRIAYIRAGRFLWFVMIAGLLGFTAATLLS